MSVECSNWAGTTDFCKTPGETKEAKRQRSEHTRWHQEENLSASLPLAQAGGVGPETRALPSKREARAQPRKCRDSGALQSANPSALQGAQLQEGHQCVLVGPGPGPALAWSTPCRCKYWDVKHSPNVRTWSQEEP